MSKFDDLKYLSVFTDTGQYPKIHDDLCVLLRRTSKDLKCVADIGACHGLLSHRLLTQCDKEFVLAVEGNKKYLENATKHPDLWYYNKYVLPSNMEDLKATLQRNEIKLVVARRVLPEICDAGGIKLVEDFACMLSEAGVEQIVLEGRVNVKGAKNKLPTVAHEALAVSAHYYPLMHYKNCVALERRK